MKTHVEKLQAAYNKNMGHVLPYFTVEKVLDIPRLIDESNPPFCVKRWRQRDKDIIMTDYSRGRDGNRAYRQNDFRLAAALDAAKAVKQAKKALELAG